MTGRRLQANPRVLLPHQEHELEFLRSHPRALLLSGTGTGKTITLLARAEEVLRAAGRVLYVTTKTVEAQVHSEAALWLPPDCRPSALVRGANGSFLTCTHTLAHKRAEALTAQPFDLVIVDEAQAVSGGGLNTGHKTFNALKAVSQMAASAVLATAEPLATTHALDLWAIAHVAGLPGLPDRYAMNGFVEWQEYQLGNSTQKVPVAISEYGFRVLLRVIRQNQVRTPIESVAALPPVTVVHHPVPLTREAARNYEAASVLGGLEGHQARQAASRDPYSLIPEVLRLLVGPYAEHASAIVFSDMFDLINPLARAFDAYGISFVQIDGGVSAKERARRLQSHRDGKARVLLMTSAGEEGLNGQHASLLISAVQSYSPARELQRVGRIRRVGSPHSEVVHAIVRPDVGHEHRRQQILDDKERLVARMWEALS